MSFGVSLTGSWARARRMLAAGGRTRVALDRAVQQEAQFYRNKIVEGLVSQAPGGVPFRPLSSSTLKVRQHLGFGGTKALIRSGDLLRSIIAQRSGFAAAFVGVSRTARSRDGKSLANIAEIHEYGAGPIVIMVTPAMRGFMAGALGGAPAEGSLLVIQIPARPFIRPVIEVYGGMIGAQRFLRRVAHLMGGGWGPLAGGTPPSR